jgi:hypothetical protein
VGGCMGEPQLCASQANSSECGRVMGCTWGPICVGTPLPCSKLETQGTCEAQAGCSWQAQ